jgi:hypothetical protein
MTHPAPSPAPRFDPSSDPRDEQLARLFAAERFYPCPPELLARIAAGLASEHVGARWSPGRRVLAFAAAVLLALGASAAWTGAVPTSAEPLWAVQAAPPGPLPQPALRLDSLPLPAQAVPGAWLPWLAVAGAALVLGGVGLARRWGVRTAGAFREVA